MGATEELEKLFECQLCGADCSGKETCKICKAFHYCTATHQKLHWRAGHSEECRRMQQQMARGLELENDPPFRFWSAHYSLGQGRPGPALICSLLDAEGIHNLGIWKTVCDCSYRNGVTYGGLEDTGGWHTPSQPLEPLQGPPRLRNWTDYLAWKGLPPSAPEPLVLHWVLTVYQSYYLALDSGRKWKQEANDRPFVIHYLGPERELDQVTVFPELARLLPMKDLVVCFISPTIPDARNATSIELGLQKAKSADNAGAECSDENSQARARICLRFFKGLYHEVLSRNAAQVEAADLVIAPNAGLAAYLTWQPTIALLAAPGAPPAFFTDYCEEAANLAAQVLTSCGAHITHKVQVNPFRQPWRIRPRDNALPSFSNGFLVGIN